MPELTLKSFESLLGSTFRVRVSEQQMHELELVEASPAGTPRSGAEREPFSLVFVGPPEPWFQQGTYPVSHSALGTTDVFLVPVGPNARGMQYQAIFS